MKKLLSVVAALIAAGCSTNTPQMPRANVTPEVNVAPTRAENQLNHHLVCRGTDPQRLAELEKALDGKKGVILYFHGGLSGVDYMQDELGPALQDSLFNSTALKDHYLNIFIDYEVDLFERSNLEENLKKWVGELAKNGVFKQFSGAFEQHSLLSKGAEIPPNMRARAIIKRAIDSKKGRATQGLTDTEISDMELLDILENDASAQAVGEAAASSPELDGITSQIQSSAQTFNGETTPKSMEFMGVTAIKVSIAVGRALVRIALGNDHQLEPTLVEETLPIVLSLNELAINHWNIVKRNSEQCFAAGKVGRELVDMLIQHQNANTAFTINTVSHSAGSIPTGVMAKYFADHGAKINSTYLIVPAISQEKFATLFLNSNDEHTGIMKLKIAALTKNAEQTDHLVKNIYNASLLYFVSGVADPSRFHDKMLLIEQHLQRDRKPYSWGLYRKSSKENPVRIWDYFDKHPDELMFYSGSHNPNYKTTASHECTKYPWVATDIAQDIIKQITEGQESSIATPPEQTAHKALKRANGACN